MGAAGTWAASLQAHAPPGSLMGGQLPLSTIGTERTRALVFQVPEGLLSQTDTARPDKGLRGKQGLGGGGAHRAG